MQSNIKEVSKRGEAWILCKIDNLLVSAEGFRRSAERYGDATSSVFGFCYPFIHRYCCFDLFLQKDREKDLVRHY